MLAGECACGLSGRGAPLCEHHRLVTARPTICSPSSLQTALLHDPAHRPDAVELLRCPWMREAHETLVRALGVSPDLTSQHALWRMPPSSLLMALCKRAAVLLSMFA